MTEPYSWRPSGDVRQKLFADHIRSLTNFDVTLTLIINDPPDCRCWPSPNGQPVRGQSLLDATGSTDPDNDTLSYAWMQLTGPSVTLAGASTSQPTFEAPVASSTQSFRFMVTVTDPDGAILYRYRHHYRPRHNSRRVGQPNHHRPTLARLP